MNKTATEKLIELAKRIIAMENDAHFQDHPEWYSITSEAQNAIDSYELQMYLNN